MRIANPFSGIAPRPRAALRSQFLSVALGFAGLWAIAGDPLSGLASQPAGGIPYPRALQDARIELSKMASGQTESLIIGNGDLYGIVWEKDGGLYLRITKNDIWDARIDTSKDGPLPKVNVRTRAMTGSTGAPPSYGTHFPNRGAPRRCASAGRTLPRLRLACGRHWICNMRWLPSAAPTVKELTCGYWRTETWFSLPRSNP